MYKISNYYDKIKYFEFKDLLNLMSTILSIFLLFCFWNEAELL